MFTSLTFTDHPLSNLERPPSHLGVLVSVPHLGKVQHAHPDGGKPHLHLRRWEQHHISHLDQLIFGKHKKQDLNSISLDTIHSHAVKFGYTAYDIQANITSNMNMVSLAKKNSFRHTGAPKRVPKLLKKSRWNTPFPTQIDSAACIASHPWKQQVTSIFSCHMFNSGLER